MRTTYSTSWGKIIGRLQAPLMVLAGCTAAPIDTRDIPETLRVPRNAALTQQVHAVGMQIYRCTLVLRRQALNACLSG